MKKLCAGILFLTVFLCFGFSQSVRSGEEAPYQGEWYQSVNFEWWSSQSGTEIYGGYGEGNGFGRVIFSQPNLMSSFGPDGVILTYNLFDYLTAGDENPDEINYLIIQELYDEAQYWLISDIDSENHLLFNLVEWNSRIDETRWAVFRINYQTSRDYYEWLTGLADLESMNDYLYGTWAADKFLTFSFSEEYSYNWDTGSDSITFKITEPRRLQWITQELQTYDYALRKETGMTMLDLEKGGALEHYYTIIPLNPNELALVQGGFKGEWFDEFDVLFFSRK
ncbi:MAG: hypothetical protein ACLFST_04950 [Spirochaetia bacterium]